MAVRIQLPDDWPRLLRLSPGVQARLRELLDRQDAGQRLTDAERGEAEGLVEPSELLTLLRLRAERAAGGPFS